MKAMRRAAILALVTMAGLALVVMLGMGDTGAVQAQMQPTPTIVPTFESSGSYQQDHNRMSRQIYQAAEFSEYSYFNTLQTLDSLAVLQQQISDVQAIASAPISLTVTWPEDYTATTYLKTLSDGNQFRIDKSYNYGESAIIILLVALLILEGVRFAWEATRAR